MEKVTVMVAGLPGKMANLVAKAIASQPDMMLYPYALSEEKGIADVESAVRVQLVPPEGHEEILLSSRAAISLIVDFTLPKSVNAHAALYCKVGVPFVMGTTGGYREKLVKTISGSSISAVVATNMAVPVVMFQEMILFAAKNFSGSLEGFRLVIKESHQAQKPDPSGTAVSLLDSFATLGMPLKKEQIIMLRDPKAQENVLNIPKKYLDGHGYHTYTLTSPDGTVLLQFTHNVLGRGVYVDGCLKAIRFLAKQRSKKGEIFSMIDVLKQTAL